MPTKMPDPVVPHPKRIAEIDVVGGIWMPYGAKASMTYQLSDHDLKNIGEFTREAFTRWLLSRSGDFSSVDDFQVRVGNETIPFATEEGKMAYYDSIVEED